MSEGAPKEPAIKKILGVPSIEDPRKEELDAAAERFVEVFHGREVMAALDRLEEEVRTAALAPRFRSKQRIEQQREGMVPRAPTEEEKRRILIRAIRRVKDSFGELGVKVREIVIDFENSKTEG